MAKRESKEERPARRPVAGERSCRWCSAAYSVRAIARHEKACEASLVPTTPDITVEDHGSIVLLVAQNANANRWLLEHTSEERQGWGLYGLAVEPRYVADIVTGAQADGLVVRRG